MNQEKIMEQEIPAHTKALSAERETFQRLERELVEHDVSIFITVRKGGQPKLEAVVDGRALRHEGPLTLGLARLLNLLQGTWSERLEGR